MGRDELYINKFRICDGATYTQHEKINPLQGIRCGGSKKLKNHEKSVKYERVDI